MAYTFSRAGLSGRSWPVSPHALCDRGGAALSQEKTAVASARNRDLHLGCVAGESEDRRHRRLCLPRARMGARPVELIPTRAKDRLVMPALVAGIHVLKAR